MGPLAIREWTSFYLTITKLASSLNAICEFCWLISYLNCMTNDCQFKWISEHGALHISFWSCIFCQSRILLYFHYVICTSVSPLVNHLDQQNFWPCIDKICKQNNLERQIAQSAKKNLEEQTAKFANKWSTKNVQKDNLQKKVDRRKNLQNCIQKWSNTTICKICKK